ncbi:NAD(P)/FAD-dependent oxidoreductase [Leifsonia sp. F6_8S_P_1B]|uniref:NAD(P)/FAD-dependent oxidoreductase n=1 Tax=Leifsonia williamsii TaxID=3035919 RepID=A0ABT8KE56_9MICO|nr:NAD(P)/FAD-dependent oxidoreductase [Leifsonia williamsii]MDN4614594.1 NAD(P)/FAD-dependent oxidoreductase [Leifsonia williamsii]
MTTHDLVIVGAGPAGVAAALTAADQGLDVLVVDEQSRAGGQIFRRPPAAFRAEAKLPVGYPWAAELLARAEADERIAWRYGTTVFGVLRAGGGDAEQPMEVFLARGAESGSVLARRVLIATGAYDLPVALPGWTLPGVMMAGAVQGLLKAQRMRAADRVVLAGAHPLLLIVAAQLVQAGAAVSEVALARSLPSPLEALRALPAIPGHLRLLLSLAGCVLTLRRAGVRISLGTVPTAVEGEDRVRAVRLAKADAAWRVRGPGRRIETDQLVLGYGFQPSAELARQLGCALVWDSAAGGWVVEHDEGMATSVSGVFVAGEPTGVAGAEQSRAEGELAALAIAADLGRAVPPRAVARARRAVRRAGRFSAVVQRMFAPRREALLDLATPHTEICRCETVSRADIDGYLDANPHVSSVNSVKLACRTGMGPCQGRYCETAVAGLVAQSRGGRIEQVGRFAAHVPVKPVALAAYAALGADEPAGEETGER